MKLVSLTFCSCVLSASAALAQQSLVLQATAGRDWNYYQAVHFDGDAQNQATASMAYSVMGGLQQARFRLLLGVCYTQNRTLGYQGRWTTTAFYFNASRRSFQIPLQLYLPLWTDLASKLSAGPLVGVAFQLNAKASPLSSSYQILERTDNSLAVVTPGGDHFTVTHNNTAHSSTWLLQVGGHFEYKISGPLAVFGEALWQAGLQPYESYSLQAQTSRGPFFTASSINSGSSRRVQVGLTLVH